MRHLCAWKTCLRSPARSERGQALVEYALVLAMISVVSIAALTQLSTGIQSFFSQANDTIDVVLKTHGHCGHKTCK
jgi:Flp pilus assembly pilin Flp